MTVFSFDEVQISLMSVFNGANSESAGTYLREVYKLIFDESLRLKMKASGDQFRFNMELSDTIE